MKTKVYILLSILQLFLVGLAAAQQVRTEIGKDKFNNEFVVERDILTGGARQVSLVDVNIERYGTRVVDLTQEAVFSVGARFISDYLEILRIDSVSLKPQKIETDGEKWYLAYAQTYRDIPIWRSNFGFTIESNGNIHTLGGETYPSASVASTIPQVTAAQASQNAKAQFEKVYKVGGVVNEKAALVIFPRALDTSISFHLVWSVAVTSFYPARKMQYLIDCFDGQVTHEENLIVHSDVTVSVKMQYWPLHHYDTPVTSQGFANVHVKLSNYLGQLVGEGYTNGNGDWTKTGIAYTYYYADIDKDLNNLANSWVKIQQGWVQTDQTPLFLPPSITRNWPTDETNLYYHVPAIHDYFTSSPFNYSTMNYQMLAYVHDGPYSNGWSDGTNIGFGSDQDQYWAGAADVVYHEYTHGTVYHIYGGWIGTSGEAGAMNEGFADYFSSAKTNDETQGESVPVTEYYLPRHLQNSYTMDDFNNLPTIHTKGQIVAGACWDLRQVLSTTDQLVFKALQRTPHAYNFSAMANNVVYEDDNDGNPNNGTPNLETIRSKFYGKKIYFTAGPPRVPQNVSISGSVGQHPTVSWSANPEPDLSGYKLYRKITPDESQFSLVATLSTSQTSWTDIHVTIRTGGTGGQYAYYYVKAYDAATNLSDVSATVYKPVNYNPPRANDGEDPILALRAQPVEFALEQNYPNPFNPETEICFALPEPSGVRITVSDILGRELLTIREGEISAGFHRVRWAGQDATGQKVSSGIYFYRITAIGESGRQFARVMKMLLAK